MPQTAACPMSSSPWEDVEAALKPIQDLVANSKGGPSCWLVDVSTNIQQTDSPREYLSESGGWNGYSFFKTSRHDIHKLDMDFQKAMIIGDYKTIPCWDPSFPFISYLVVSSFSGVGGDLPRSQGFIAGADAMPLAVQTLSVVTRRRVDASLGVPGMKAWQLKLLSLWILTWFIAMPMGSSFFMNCMVLLFTFWIILEYFLFDLIWKISPRTCGK